jgi:hypothetical protein
VEYSKLNDAKVIEALVNRWGDMILEAKSERELMTIRDFLAVAREAADMARPKNIEPHRWPEIARNVVMQSGIYQLDRAATFRMRVFNGADIMGNGDNLTRQMINYARLTVQVRTPQEQQRDSEDMMAKVADYTAQATWRTPSPQRPSTRR